MPEGWEPLPKMDRSITVETLDVAGVHSVLTQIARKLLVCVHSVCCTPKYLTSSRTPGPGTLFLASRQERGSAKYVNLRALQNTSIVAVQLSGRTKGCSPITSYVSEGMIYAAISPCHAPTHSNFLQPPILFLCHWPATAGWTMK
jgi:hypothetical protein